MPAPGPSLLDGLTRFGLPGTVIAVLFVLLWLKDRELTREREARIIDAKSYTDMALKLQGEVLQAVQKIVLVFDELKRRMPQ